MKVMIYLSKKTQDMNVKSFGEKLLSFDQIIVGSLLEGNSVLLKLISFEIFSEISF